MSQTRVIAPAPPKTPLGQGHRQRHWPCYLLCEDHAVIGSILQAGVECIQLVAGAVHIVPVLGIQLDEGAGQGGVLLPCFVGGSWLGAHQVETPPCCI